MSEQNTLNFTNNPLDPDLFSGEDDFDSRNADTIHVHQNPNYRTSSRIHERKVVPGPRRTPLVLPVEPHKVNGRQLTRATLKRDRDMLNAR